MKKFRFDLKAGITIILLASSPYDAFQRFLSIFGQHLANDIIDIIVIH